MVLTDPKYHLIFPERRKVLAGRDFPHWWVFARGRSLGYVKGITVASWFVRLRLKQGGYHQSRLGEADDKFRADGQKILSFDQAYEKAEDWCERHAGIASRRYLDHQNHPVYPDLPPAPPYTIAHAMVDYMRWYRENRRGFPRIYYDARAYVIPKFGHLPVDDLTTRMIREWLDGLAETPARIRVRDGEEPQYKIKTNDPEELRRRRNTVNRTLAIVKAALNRAYEHGYVDSSLSWSRVKKFRRVDPMAPRYLEKSECLQLIAACPLELRELVVAALFTGCRVGELRAMRVGDFLPDINRVVIKDGKGGRLRHISLTEDGISFFFGLSRGRSADEFMFIRKDGRPWRAGGYQRLFYKTVVKAEMARHVTFHHLRHTYAAHAAMAGIPLQVIARQLGHVDTRMIERQYAHLGSSYLDEMIRTTMPNLVSAG